MKKDGREWSAVVARHTNGHEYRLFYNLYWPLKEGELEPHLNVNVFNWIVGFDPVGIASYTGKDFDDYFNMLTGKSYELKYTYQQEVKLSLISQQHLSHLTRLKKNLLSMKLILTQ